MQIVVKGFATGALVFQTGDVDPGSSINLGISELSAGDPSTTLTYPASVPLSAQLGQFPSTVTLSMSQLQSSAPALIAINEGPFGALVSLSTTPLQATCGVGTLLQPGESLLLQKTVDANSADAPAALYLMGAAIGFGATIVIKFGSIAIDYRYQFTGASNG